MTVPRLGPLCFELGVLTVGMMVVCALFGW